MTKTATKPRKTVAQAPIEVKAEPTNNFDLIETNDMSQKAFGGSELMLKRIYGGDVSRELLKKVQIVPSRLRELDSSRHRIFLANDLPNDPESQFLSDSGWSKFHKLVFVSHWQRDQYISMYGIPYSKCAVVQNAIQLNPNFSVDKKLAKKDDTVRLIYHTTPHRGLEILVPVVEKLVADMPDTKMHLDVFSSFGIYGWESRDEPFAELFNRIKSNPNMTYHGFKTNSDVRVSVEEADIFAYPSIWPETSCLSLMEAMVSGCVCVHPNLAALPETAANWTWMYSMDEEKNKHAGDFYHVLKTAIETMKHMRSNDEESLLKNRLRGQVNYGNVFFNWKLRKIQWEQLLAAVVNMPLELEDNSMFTYRA